MKKLCGFVGLIIFACTGCGPEDDFSDGGLPDAGIQDAGNDCAVICETDADCCAGQVCREGVCSDPLACATGCHSECGPGWHCDRQSQLCVQGGIDGTCVYDCDCYADQTCFEGQCVQACGTDSDCARGEVCQAGACVESAGCTSRDDCAGEECLVCRDGECVAPPAVCTSDDDCCLGMHCNFSACVADSLPCETDADCTHPETPVCIDGKCAAVGSECQVDGDCPEDNQACEDGVCVATGCAAEGCETGYYCDATTGECKPGCDSNDDCVAPMTCDYVNHLCVETDCCGGVCDPDTQLCDSETCQCFTPCTTGSCPEGSHCNTQTGHCEPDDVDCSDTGCPEGWTCNTETGLCEEDPFDCNVDGCGAGYECNELTGQCEAVVEECEAQAITCGGVVSGAFEAGCESTQRSGSYAKQFSFTSTAGTLVTIDLISDEDTYLYLLDATGAVVDYDDDGGASLDSQIVTTLPADGRYTIEATTYSSAVTGTFDLQLTCQEGGACTQSISCGQMVYGSWTGECEDPGFPGFYARFYTFEVVENQDIEISLSSSTVDTYLIILGPDGEVQASNDDAGLFNSDSFLGGTILEGGTWTIDATTYEEGATGDFELELVCL